MEFVVLKRSKIDDFWRVRNALHFKQTTDWRNIECQEPLDVGASNKIMPPVYRSVVLDKSFAY